MIVPVWMTVFFSALLPANSETTNLIRNGSFETPVMDRAWGFTQVDQWRDGTFGGLLEVWNAPLMGLQAPDGQQILELNSTGQHEIKQDVLVEPNSTYRLSWYQKKRVSIDESTTGEIDSADAIIEQALCYAEDFEWNLCELEFNSGDNTFITVIIGPNTSGSMGNLIDDVRLELVSSPPSSPTPTPSDTLLPTETPEPTPSQTSSPSETVEPSPTESEPSVDPSPSQSEVVPSPSDEPLPTLLPTEPAPLPSPDNSNPAPVPAPEETLIDTSIAETVMLANGVVLPVEVKQALEIFQSPSDTVKTLFTDPKKFFTAVNNIGADMRPETRDKAQKVVISAIIVIQVIAGTMTTILRMP